ncbi:MAG: MBL fold metallo-hydrolase [Bacteroides sp.]|nr:MBL fold metallo-hydrolase [Bacteroides sp.]
MKITYIYQSGFAIETENFSILIDYYKDTHSFQGYVHMYLLQNQNPLYIFSSHSHPDHFNPEILKWKRTKNNIIYLFSQEISELHPALPEDIYLLNKGEIYQDAFISVKAFGSTDIGISFLMGADNKKIFHSGDLNNWHWKDESTMEESTIAEQEYLKELELVYQEAPQLDITMFPVDPRLGSEYMKGAQQFIDCIDTKLFIPMHFGDEYDKANAFSKYAEAKRTHFMKITTKGQSINI